MIHRRKLVRFSSPRNQSGMSLLEIIIVIVLIGAVLTLVGSRVLGGADRGKANIAKSQVQT
ncbi:type II secretion system protein GspG, partial [Staphylococcus hominis]